jgi:hypothetical protein
MVVFSVIHRFLIHTSLKVKYTRLMDFLCMPVSNMKSNISATKSSPQSSVPNSTVHGRIIRPRVKTINT